MRVRREIPGDGVVQGATDRHHVRLQLGAHRRRHVERRRGGGVEDPTLSGRCGTSAAGSALLDHLVVHRRQPRQVTGETRQVAAVTPATPPVDSITALV